MALSTPLDAEIRRLIALAGPMPLAQYMSLCLTHPQHGYYTTRDPFGVHGDFTTAPEISQMFGELIGLWTAAVWRQMGSPENVRLVELGPGRGSLMNDALRAARVMPGYRDAVEVHLVEISPALERRQRETLADVDVPLHWHRALDEVPDGPLIVLANEFFDALPIHQCVKREDGWHERVVGTDAIGHLVFGLAADPLPHFDRLLPPPLRAAPLGAVFEWRADHVAFELGRRLAHFGGAALVIDYGHGESAVGDTLQAVGEHAFADPLKEPGAVDLTAHVDFQALAQAAESMGARAQGPIEQGEFLRRLGIDSRAAKLKAGGAPDKGADVELALTRLTGGGASGMGTLFKAMGFAHPSLGTLPAFDG
jgi:NADH dehydrogenase [ubiquinone] 1 alpha subcomplex assembly factor 7